MKTSTLLLGLAAAGLLGAGVWIGRAASPSAVPATAIAHTETRAQTALPAGAAAPAITTRTPAPTLARRSSGASRALLADLRDVDPKVRRAAVREVANSDDADPELLKTASRDADLEVAVTATGGLARLYARGQLPVQELAARATDHALNPRVRLTALNAFAASPSLEGAAVLVDLAARGDVTERATAAILLAQQDEALAVPALLRLLGDAEEDVRANAHESLRARARGRDFGTDAAAWQAWWQARQ
ncbi:MAG: hypothetical protein SFX73_12845 [Kofleriaceae bacterium]|nr:hypothetical protein [Kofleriaceae bacterium]